MADLIVTGIEVTAAALAIPGAATVILFRPLRKMSHRFGQFLDDWGGETSRIGVPARPGVMERLSKIEERQVAVSNEALKTRTEVRTQLVASEKRTAAVLADLDVRLGEAQEQLAVVHHEMLPNGGYSLKDQVNRIDPALNDDGTPKHE
jgi:hypothetical protein